MSASIEDWWPRLAPETRDWLIANDGDAVPASVLEEITRAGGLVATDAWWVGQNGPTGFYLSDEAVDWIDEVANGETPQRRGDSWANWPERHASGSGRGATASRLREEVLLPRVEVE